MKHISEHDKMKMVITLCEVMEIQGDNKIIQKLKNESWKELVGFVSNCDPQWIVQLLLRVREDATEKERVNF